MRTTVHEEIPQDPQVREAWNKLILGMERSEVFFTPQWATAVSRAFHEQLTPLLILFYESERLIGGAALAVNPESPGTAFFLAASTADYCDVFSLPENRKLILIELLRELRKLGIWDLVLANLPSDSRTCLELPYAAAVSGYHVSSRAAYKCGFVELGNEQQRLSLLEEITRRERKKRDLKKLAAAGDVTVAHLQSFCASAPPLDAIISAHVARFLASGRISPLVRPERREFLRQLATLLGDAGWLCISQLEINQKPIAWNYGFRYSDSWFWYLPTFQTEHRDLSPGSCLLRLLLEDACKDFSVHRLDLGLGEEPYKDRFTNGARYTQFVQLSTSRLQHVINLGNNARNNFGTVHPSVKNALLQARSTARKLTTCIKNAGLGITLAHGARATAQLVARKRELVFFQACQPNPAIGAGWQLATLAWDDLARAAIHNSDDASTLDYLLRCGRRLKESENSGFVLREETGRPVHFLWLAKYAGFQLHEIDHTLHSEDDARLIFDCWTPVKERGKGHYVVALISLAWATAQQNQSVWVFASAENVASQRGILKAGFVRRFSLVETKILGRPRVIRR